MFNKTNQPNQREASTNAQIMIKPRGRSRNKHAISQIISSKPPLVSLQARKNMANELYSSKSNIVNIIETYKFYTKLLELDNTNIKWNSEANEAKKAFSKGISSKKKRNIKTMQVMYSSIDYQSKLIQFLRWINSTEHIIRQSSIKPEEYDKNIEKLWGDGINTTHNQPLSLDNSNLFYQKWYSTLTSLKTEIIDQSENEHYIQLIYLVIKNIQNQGNTTESKFIFFVFILTYLSLTPNDQYTNIILFKHKENINQIIDDLQKTLESSIKNKIEAMKKIDDITTDNNELMIDEKTTTIDPKSVIDRYKIDISKPDCITLSYFREKVTLKLKDISIKLVKEYFLQVFNKTLHISALKYYCRTYNKSIESHYYSSVLVLIKSITKTIILSKTLSTFYDIHMKERYLNIDYPINEEIFEEIWTKIHFTPIHSFDVYGFTDHSTLNIFINCLPRIITKPRIQLMHVKKSICGILNVGVIILTLIHEIIGHYLKDFVNLSQSTNIINSYDEKRTEGEEDEEEVGEGGFFVEDKLFGSIEKVSIRFVQFLCDETNWKLNYPTFRKKIESFNTYVPNRDCKNFKSLIESLKINDFDYDVYSKNRSIIQAKRGNDFGIERGMCGTQIIRSSPYFRWDLGNKQKRVQNEYQSNNADDELGKDDDVEDNAENSDHSQEDEPILGKKTKRKELKKDCNINFLQDSNIQGQNSRITVKKKK